MSRLGDSLGSPRNNRGYRQNGSRLPNGTR